MDRIDTRLRRAAEETRQAAGRHLPPPLHRPEMGGMGWLVLATAFAAVLIVFAVPMLIGRQTAPLGESAPTPMPTPTTVVGDPTTTSLEPANSSCSGEGVAEPTLSPDLPAPVAGTARAIIRFAMMCSFDGLAGLPPDGITTSFGGGGLHDLGRWEAEGRGEMDTLIRLFGTTHQVLEVEDGADIYQWPAAFVYDTWEEIPHEYLTELVDLGVYTEGELDEIAGFGSYAGWRTGIDEEGNWLFFVAGD